MNKKKLSIIILSLIILVGAALRIYGLNRFPPELFGDEIDVGYHAYSLLHTGRDYRGDFLPTYIHSFDEWRAPLLMYATVPTVALFGLNPWGVRMAPAIFGILGIFLIYLFVDELTENRYIALCAAAVTAIAPWHIQYSRTAYEVTLLFDLCVFGMWCWLKGMRRPVWLVGTAISFALMFYTYSTASLFVPLLGLGLLCIYFRQLRQLPIKWIGIALATFVIIMLPFALQIINGNAGQRFGLISIFTNQSAEVAKVENARNVPPFPPDTPFHGSLTALSQKLFENKPLYYANLFTHNYLSAFSPEFLFLSGDPNPRQSVGTMGEYYSLFALFLVLGLIYVVKRSRPEWKMLLLLTLIAPVSAALTVEGANHATRLFLLNIPLLILIGFGLWYLIRSARSTVGLIILVVAGLIGFISIAAYLNQYYVHYPVESYQSWQYGYADALSYVNQNQQNYQRIFVTDEQDPPLYRILFYTQYDPALFQKQFTDDKLVPNFMPGFDGFFVGKYAVVVPSGQNTQFTLAKYLDRQTLYVVSQKSAQGSDWRTQPPPGIRVLHTTTDPYNYPIFYVVTHQ